MKRLFVLAAAAALSACGDSSSSTPPPASFPRPAGYIAVSMSVNDSTNRVFANNELGWKGSMKFAGETNRIITEDASWGGPFASLYDDGPWTQGGHEDATGMAGDHIFGAVVFVKPPATAGTNTTIFYGMNDNVYVAMPQGDGWIWPPGDNGSFVVYAGQTTDVKAGGLTLPAHGTIDLQLKLDTTILTPPDGGGAWATNTVAVKGTSTSWVAVPVTSPTAGVYTFTLSSVAGAGKTFYHSGLVKSGDKPEWIWVLGGSQYKTTNVGTNTLEAATGGVTAFTKPVGGAFTAGNVLLNAGNHNTYVTVP